MECRIYEQNIAYRIRKIGGRTVLIGENKCYELNEVACEIWNCLENERSDQDIVNYLVKEFDVDIKILEQDIYDFINEMKSNNVIKVIEDE